MKKVYVVFENEYDGDCHLWLCVREIFDTEEKAKSYCDDKNSCGEEFSYETWEVR